MGEIFSLPESSSLPSVVSESVDRPMIGPQIEPKTLNTELYEGTWWEIAKYPNKWEIGCDKASAEYRWDEENKKLWVTNNCYKKIEGKYTIVQRRRGYAYITDELHPRKLSLIFDDEFGTTPISTYEILWTDYINYSIVGGGEDYLWLLSRKSYVRRGDLPAIIRKIRSLGGDTSRMIPNPESILD